MLPKWPKCVEVPFNLITIEQIQLSCPVLFFIPNNAIRQIDNTMIVLVSQKIGSAEIFFSATRVRRCTSMGIYYLYMGMQPWHTCIHFAAKAAHIRPLFWTFPEIKEREN